MMSIKILSSIFYLLSSVRQCRRFGLLGLMLIASVGVTNCRQDMHDQPRFEPLEANAFFSDGRASRPLIEGTVARGHLKLDKHFFTGMVDGELVATFPFLITEDVLKRGRERYNIFCAPCQIHKPPAPPHRSSAPVSEFYSTEVLSIRNHSLLSHQFFLYILRHVFNGGILALL